MGKGSLYENNQKIDNDIDMDDTIDDLIYKLQLLKIKYKDYDLTYTIGAGYSNVEFEISCVREETTAERAKRLQEEDKKKQKRLKKLKEDFFKAKEKLENAKLS